MIQPSTFFNLFIFDINYNGTQLGGLIPLSFFLYLYVLLITKGFNSSSHVNEIIIE